MIILETEAEFLEDASSMDCSVIICTRNRSRELINVLTTMAAMTIPPHLEWELLVVDNGSSDDTPATIASFADRLPITRVWEPNAGLSNARNAGVRHARGRLIVWTDDDTRVVPGWLAAFYAAFTAHPEAALFAGRITPALLPPTPNWFRDAAADLHYLLATRDFGPDPVPLSIEGERYPFGASAAVRAVEQRQFLYDPELGVAPGRRRGGEETAVFVSILAAGHTGWWVPDAEVEHQVVSERQTTGYIREYYGSMGEAWAISGASTGPMIARAPFATWAKVVTGSVRYAVARVTRSSSWQRYLASASFHRGALAYFRRADQK
ncbi:glycosyltransferase family A protein [Glacieibacterium megasporae]|uniref:glycosyltransferase family A protein n=1 Tax=Glacieibacterium megasporae TaxID=2835787 RepID=UPI001C1DD03D|nr:glycosyltransferase family 2 protein [Polymorphobacter megasporae]